MSAQAESVLVSEEEHPLVERHWFLIQCRPGQNERARENLENQQYACFDPHMDVERLRGGRRQYRREPMFPGYLFIHLALSGESWHSIRSTRGVRGLVHFGNEPARVPDEVVDEVWNRSGTGVGQGELVPALQKGDRLHIRKGPFADFEGIFERYDGEERVIVLFNMLHKQHRLTLGVGDIEKT